ncbi:MAG: iron chelate uptake ABC transporter family permease subunit [Nitrobacter sp.]
MIRLALNTERPIPSDCAVVIHGRVIRYIQNICLTQDVGRDQTLSPRGRDHARHSVVTTADLFLLTTGKFIGATGQGAVIAVVKLFAGTLLLALRWRINLLSLGEVDAQALDVNVDVDVLRWVLSGLAAMIAAQVSVSGGVGWIKLIVSASGAALVWPDRSRLLPTAVVLGDLHLLATTMYSQRD